MSSPTLTRRAAIVGAIASSAALALPVAAAVAPADEAAAHIDDLMRQLSAALTAEYGGDFECTVGPDGEVSYRWAAIPASQRFDQHFAGLVDALDEMAGDADGWTMSCGRGHDATVWKNVHRSYLVNEEVLDSSGLPIGTIPVTRAHPVDEVSL